MRRLPALILVMWTLATVARAGELCLVPSATNDRNITFTCDGRFIANEWIGYSTDGTSICYDYPYPCEFNAVIVWTISSSPDSPLANSGPLPAEASLYLWLICDTVGSGIQVAEFDLAGTDLNVVDFVPMNGFLNAGTATSLLLAVGGCPNGGVPGLLAGRIDVETAVGVDAVTWGRIKSGYR